MTKPTHFKPVIIGMRGFFQSGKDTVAYMLEDLFDQDGYDVDVQSFAYNLRKAVALIFGIDMKEVFSEEFKKNRTKVSKLKYNYIPDPETQPPNVRSELYRQWDEEPEWKRGGKLSGRGLLQFFGTEICRTMDPDCWARGGINNILRGDIDVGILKDGRFMNEIKAIRDNGNPSFIIRVERPGHNGDGHQSERELADASGIDDFVIQNDGSLEDLEKKVQQIYRVIRERIDEANKSIG